MICYYSQYNSENTISWIPPIVNSSDSALRATTGQEGLGRFCQVVYPENARKVGELQILCCQGIKVTDYNFTLDASRKAGFHV
jgi:hypothetical protein